MRVITILFVLLSEYLSITDATSSIAGWSYLGNFTSNVPAYTFLIDVTNNGNPDLLVNGFEAFKAGSVGLVGDAAATADGMSTAQVSTIFDDLFWPNYVFRAPEGVWDAGDVTLVVADGFLLPGSTPGNVYALHLTDGELVASESLTGSKANILHYGIFYGLAEMRDLRGDGTYDILATRVHTEGFGTWEQAHLVVLTRPDDPNEEQEWEYTELIEGTDFAFVCRDFVDADGARKLAIVSGSFVNSRLSLYEADLSTFPPTISEEALIDDTAGAIYSTQVLDLDGDGKDELLVSNHMDNATLAAVYVYELPESTSEWYSTVSKEGLTRHMIANNFQVLNPGTGKAAPGFPVPYYPSVESATGTKHIVVQGDDNGAVYVLSPTDTAWEYEKTELRLYGDRVGLPSIADVDNDGYMEMFVPDYANNLVHAYTTKP